MVFKSNYYIVPLKQQQDKEISQLQLEDHFQKVDNKLQDLREKWIRGNKLKKDYLTSSNRKVPWGLLAFRNF